MIFIFFDLCDAALLFAGFFDFHILEFLPFKFLDEKPSKPN